MNTKIFRKTLLMILIVSALIAACAPSTNQVRTIMVEKLYAGTWYLVAYGNNDELTIVPPGLRVFANFQEDGTINGNAGCNNFFGTFKASDDGSFSLEGSLGSTMMFCDQFMDEESTFLSAMQSAKGFYFNEMDQLVIEFTDSADGYDKMVLINQQNALLLGSGWVLTSLITPDGEITIPPASAPLLNLSEDGSMTGDGGCNRIWSEFTAEDGVISIGPIASTRMYCEAVMDLEVSYTIGLEQVTRYEIIGNQLILSDDLNTTVLTFFTTAFELTQTQWRLYALNGEAIPENILVTLALQPGDEAGGGTLYGNGGCNRYSGEYALEGDRVNFSILAVSAMFCENSMAIEDAFLAALQDGMTFQIEYNRLILTSENNTLIFLGEKPTVVGNWRLLRMGTPENPVDIPFEQTTLAEIIIGEKAATGLITGTTPCCEYTAGLFIDRDFITFGMPEMINLNQCAEMSEIETQYFEALQIAVQYEFSNGNLILRDGEGTQLLEFDLQF